MSVYEEIIQQNQDLSICARIVTRLKGAMEYLYSHEKLRDAGHIGAWSNQAEWLSLLAWANSRMFPLIGGTSISLPLNMFMSICILILALFSTQIMCTKIFQRSENIKPASQKHAIYVRIDFTQVTFIICSFLSSFVDWLIIEINYFLFLMWSSYSRVW